jgi:ABC-type Fe3+-hydroxamate transport system substrate-binding protein
VKSRIWDIVPTVVTRRLALAALLLAVAVSGCGERDEPLGELDQRYPVTVQGAGDRPAVATARPERIVALDSGSAELVIALGARDRLVGVPATMARGDGPLQAPPPAADVVSQGEHVRVDEIRRLEPDLIVATPANDLVDVSRAQRRTEAVAYVQPGSSVEDVLRATLELGFLLGEPVAARQLASDIRSRVAAVEERVAGRPPATTFVDTGFFITITNRSLLGDLIRRAGGESVAGATNGGGPVPLGRLRRLDPQVYLATSDGRVTLASLRRNAQTARLTAVREGRFAVLPSDLVNRAGPRIGAALQRVAEALHPDAFR